MEAGRENGRRREKRRGEGENGKKIKENSREIHRNECERN